MSLPTAPPPGYYPDPSGSGQRWWDGMQWTSHVGAAPTADPFAAAYVTPVGSTSARDWARVSVVAVVVLALIAGMAAYRAVTHGGAAGSHSPGLGPAPGPRLSASAPAALGPPMTPEPAPNQPVVTAAQAGQVVRAFWPAHEYALLNRNLALLGRLDTGAAASYEQGAVACGCLFWGRARTFENAWYAVPEQRSYPAHFLAEAQWTANGTTWTDLLVFTKSAAGRPWLLAEDSGYGPLLGQQVGLGHLRTVEGSDYALPVTRQQHVRAQTLARQLAQLWQRAKQTGRIPTSSVFNLTGNLRTQLQSFATNRQDTLQTNGELGHYTFSVDSADRMYEFDDSGYDIACQVVRDTVVSRDPTGAPIVQDVGRKAWGPLLAPGRYRTVTSRDAWQTCFVISPTSQPVIVLDSEVGGSVTSAR